MQCSNYITTLKELSISRLATLICGIRLLENSYSIRETAKYVNQLPVNLIDDIFSHIVDVNDECLSSTEIAVLLHPQKKVLIIDDLVNANGSCFDVQLMLNISGQNMKNLTELQLPVACSLQPEVCSELCLLACNLKKLNLYSVQVTDEVMKYISNLHLVELNFSYTAITDFGASQLCVEESNTKSSLRIIHTYGSQMSARGHVPILESMPNLEDVDSNYSTLTLLGLLSSQRQRCFTLALRRLRTTPIRPSVVTDKDVQLALETCPEVEEVQLDRLKDAKLILNLLPQFNHLTRLELNFDYIDEWCFSLEEFSPVLRIFSDRLTDLKISNFPSKNSSQLIFNFDFTCLKNLSLMDHKNYPVSHNLLVSFLSTSYNLKCLRLMCASLTDDVIYQVLSKNSFDRLDCLSLSNCPNLNVTGATQLLKISTLTMVTLTDSLSREEQEELFAQVDADKLNLFCADVNLYF